MPLVAHRRFRQFNFRPCCVQQYSWYWQCMRIKYLLSLPLSKLKHCPCHKPTERNPVGWWQEGEEARESVHLVQSIFQAFSDQENIEHCNSNGGALSWWKWHPRSNPQFDASRNSQSYQGTQYRWCCALRRKGRCLHREISHTIRSTLDCRKCFRTA